MPAPAAMPTFAQVVALGIEMAESQLEMLVRISHEDDEWQYPNECVSASVELVLNNIRSLREMAFDDFGAFSSMWFPIAAVIELCCKMFQPVNQVYGRCLTDVRELFRQTAVMAEHAEMKAQKAAK